MLRQQIHQSKIAIAELVAKLQEEQAKLDRLNARVEKYEEAIAVLQEAIAEDPLLWDEARSRLQPAWLQDAIATETLSITNGAIPGLLDSPMSEQIFDAECLPKQEFPTIVWDGSGVARLGCAKQKLAKEWAGLLTLWGCSISVVRAESFSDKDINWEVAITNITRSQIEALAKAHTSPHAEVPAPGKKKVGDQMSAQATEIASVGEKISESLGSSRVGDFDLGIPLPWELALEILKRYRDLDAGNLDPADFEEYPEEMLEEAFSWLEDKGYLSGFNGSGWDLDSKYYGECLPELEIAIRDFEEIHGEEFALLGKAEAEAISCVAYAILTYHLEKKKLKSNVDQFIKRFPRGLIEEAYSWLEEKRCVEYPSSFEGARLIEPYCEEGKVALALEELLNNFEQLSPTVDEVLSGASPLNLPAAQLDELEQALAGSTTPSIDDDPDLSPSPYAEEMAAKIKVGTKLKSLPCPGDAKHKHSKKRTGIVRRIERIGANIYAFVAELSEAGNNSRQTAYYNLEAVEILEDAPAIELAIHVAKEPAPNNNDFNHFEPFDPIEFALQSESSGAGLEVEILQFLVEKAAQADLYEGNNPDASFSEIGDAVKLAPEDFDRIEVALEKLEARGLVSHRDTLTGGDRWQIAPEKPSQDHSFKVGDRVTICGDSKGEDLIGKSGTLTAVSLTGCVLYLDGEDENNRLFFCKEDLSPCSTFSQAA